MKRIYQAPETITISVRNRVSLMGISTEEPTGRQAEGDPTNNGVPINIGETAVTSDPFAGHGQDGNSTRSRENLWDSW